MPPRRTVARGIYRDPYGFEVRVMVGGVVYSARRPLHTTVAELRKVRNGLRATGHTASPRPARGTLAADVARYLDLVSHLRSWMEHRSELRAWLARFPTARRDQIRPAHVLQARIAWLEAGVKPKTINNRVDALNRRLYKRLDGRRSLTPCEDVAPLPVERTPIQRVSAATILAVDAHLQRGEQAGTLRSAKARARFRVLVSTGRRPSEIMRAQPQDVNLAARVWVVRDGKGGYTPGIYLNDDMLAAWTLFISAGAWGPFTEGSFVRTLRHAGWPTGVRPYQARHSLGIALSELGHDLDDVGAALGHKRRETTRKHYVPVLESRMQRLSESVDGRFQGWPKV